MRHFALKTNVGTWAALGAAVLFGAGTPVAKLLLAALLYLGSGAGLWMLRHWMQPAPARLAKVEWLWLADATVSGGMLGPA